MVRVSPPHHFRAEHISCAIVTSGKYLNFTTPFPDSNYYIATFGGCPFLVMNKTPSCVLLLFEGEPREFMFYSGIVDTSK
jgi:hypothetical protein